MNTDQVVSCVFRAERNKNNPHPVAVLFEEPGTNDPGTMTVFSPSEGHSSCTMEWYCRTRAATPEEKAAVLKAMEAHGYTVACHRKIPSGAFLTRYAKTLQTKKP